MAGIILFAIMAPKASRGRAGLRAERLGWRGFFLDLISSVRTCERVKNTDLRCIEMYGGVRLLEPLHQKVHCCRDTTTCINVFGPGDEAWERDAYDTHSFTEFCLYQSRKKECINIQCNLPGLVGKLTKICLSVSCCWLAEHVGAGWRNT